MMSMRRFLNVKQLKQIHHSFRRYFLSEAYNCQEAWNKRFESPVLSSIKPINFLGEIDNLYNTEKVINAIDVDIYLNCLTEENCEDELSDLLHKLRLSSQTTFTLNSTQHAVVRYCLQFGYDSTILTILNDRINYGIFCDHFCYNLLMDYFIKKKDYVSAAKVSCYHMLQEDYSNPITNALSIYSCHKYLENPDQWQEEDPEVVRLREEPEEEVKIRVKYIRNPYFDDHFDLWKPSDLVGKTLLSIGRTMDNPLGRTCQLRGYLLFRKFNDAISLLNKWKDSSIKDAIYKDVIELIKKDVPELSENKEHMSLFTELESLKLVENNLDRDIQDLVANSINEQADKDVENQKKAYKDWENQRLIMLRRQKEELDRKRSLENIEELKKELIQKEELLTFFENEEKIELKIEAKLQKEKEREEKQAKGKNKKSSIDEYVSPDKVRRLRMRQK